MRSAAKITVTCDRCDIFEEDFELCALAIKGEWDERYIKNHLKKDGWIVTENNEEICPDCVEKLDLCTEEKGE